MAQRSRLPLWIDTLLVAAAAAVMLAWSWARWPDVVVDFGRELYIAWQVSDGRLLFRDLGYFQGPLAPYLNALWFRLFGPGLWTLAGCNMVLLLVLVVALRGLLQRIAGRLATTAALLVFIVLFAFAQLVGIGNYNYICPYAHDVTHGLLAAVLGLRAFAAYLDRPRLSMAAASGVCLGLVFLTKPELFLAAALALAVGWSTVWRRGRQRRQELATVLAASLVAPPAIAWCLLAAAGSPGLATQTVLGGWPWVIQPAASQLPFYRASMGLDAPWFHLRQAALAAIWYAGLYGAAVTMSMPRRAGQWLSPRMLAAAAGLIAAIVVYRWLDIGDLARPLPFLLAWLVIRHRTSVLARVLLVFGLGLLLKIALFTRIHHYGFALAMPGTLLAVVAAVEWGPAWWQKHGVDPRRLPVLASTVVALVVAMHLPVMGGWFALKDTPVGAGRDAFIADARGRIVQRAVELVQERAQSGDTLAVIPDGLMINYVARRVNPLPHQQYLPFDTALMGEERLARLFMDHPPDLIGYIERDTSEYGSHYFGRDYGQELAEWISRQYRPVARAGAAPFTEGLFGFLLLDRR